MALPTIPQPAPTVGKSDWFVHDRFGLFVHWGIYSAAARHEWVKNREEIPDAVYQRYFDHFDPDLYDPKEWARAAKEAGMRYVVVTTKHHDGFCLFDSKLTDYKATNTPARRDLIAPLVEAFRAEGLRIGFYYSLIDWHHPEFPIDGLHPQRNDLAYRDANRDRDIRKYAEYLHGQVRELLTNYGKIDILWYDVAWPLDAAGWESGKMNNMVFQLQPDIIVNNRIKLPGDFSTPEQRIVAEADKDWESCMTMNDSWGYHKADDNWKPPRTCLRNLITCARLGGNYLLNIGPMADGSVPVESARILTTMGAWLGRNSESIYQAEPCQVSRSNYISFTRRGHTLYAHVHYWPGPVVTIGGLRNKVLGAKLLATGAPVRFEQDEFRVRFTGLPAAPPDTPITTIAVDCDGEPRQDMDHIRVDRPRLKV